MRKSRKKRTVFFIFQSSVDCAVSAFFLCICATLWYVLTLHSCSDSIVILFQQTNQVHVLFTLIHFSGSYLFLGHFARIQVGQNLHALFETRETPRITIPHGHKELKILSIKFVKNKTFFNSMYLRINFALNFRRTGKKTSRNNATTIFSQRR